MKIKIVESGGVAGVHNVLFDSDRMEALAKAAVLTDETKVNKTDYFTISLEVDGKKAKFQTMSSGADLPKPVYDLLEYMRCNDGALWAKK